jgi:hypothetical protein
MNRWQWFQLISFQVIWFVAVFGRNQWLLVALLILLLHFAFSPEKKSDLKVLSLALLGIGIDAMLTAFGVFQFDETPFWLAVLWLAFVLNFGHSLLYLRRLKTPWLVALGACAGCYVYLLSWKLGAVVLPLGVLFTGLLVGVIWAVLLPIMVKADQRLRDIS